MTDLTTLVQQLESDDASQRAAAAEAICQSDEPGAATLALVNACGDSEESVREWAIAALEGLETPDPAYIKGLTAQLASPNAAGAYWAATLLGRIGGEASSAVSELALLVNRSDIDLAARERGIWALGKIGTPALSILKEAAQSSHDRLSQLAQKAVDTLS